MSYYTAQCNSSVKHPKTKRELMYAIAEKVGGARGKRIRETLGRRYPSTICLEKPLSDEEFATQLKRAEVGIRRFGRFSSYLYGSMRLNRWARIRQPGGMPNCLGRDLSRCVLTPNRNGLE